MVLAWGDYAGQSLRADPSRPSGAYLLTPGNKLNGGVFRTGTHAYASVDSRVTGVMSEKKAADMLEQGTILPTAEHARPFGVCGPDPLAEGQQHAAVAIGGVVEMVVDSIDDVLAGDVVVVLPAALRPSDGVPRASRATQRPGGIVVATVVQPGSAVSRRESAYRSLGYESPVVCTVMLHLNDGPAPPVPTDDVREFCRIVCAFVGEPSVSVQKMASAISQNGAVAITRESNVALSAQVAAKTRAGSITDENFALARSIVENVIAASEAKGASAAGPTATAADACRDVLAWATGLDEDMMWRTLWLLPLGWDPTSPPDVFHGTHNFSLKDLVAMSVLALRALAASRDSLGA